MKTEKIDSTAAGATSAGDVETSSTMIQAARGREPIYLASQLASICDVDLKTIHNWCGREEAPGSGGELESFRTPGGHLRFRHGAVLRFLARWGYPIPDALLTDRPHAMVIEPDPARRARLIEELGLRRIASAPRGPSDPNGEEPASAGLYAAPGWYLHLWGDAYAALISAGVRAGAGAPMDLAIARVPIEGMDATTWRYALSSRPETRAMRFVLLDGAPDAPTPPLNNGPAITDTHVVAHLASDAYGALHAVLATLASELSPTRAFVPPSPRRFEGSIARSDRGRIHPREPLYVASQVAELWDVDLKTVHNWVERGDIEAFSTPGRHLRFRRRSLLHFLRRYDMAIPRELAPTRPRVAIVDARVEQARKLAWMLSPSFDAHVVNEPTAALVDIGSQCAGAGLVDAVVLTLPATGVDPERYLRALTDHAETRYSSVVVIADGASEHEAIRWQQAGALATVFDGDTTRVATVLARALGARAGATPS
jgi:hypothetical protein